MRGLTLTGTHGGTLTVRPAEHTRECLQVLIGCGGRTNLDEFTPEQAAQLRDVLSEWLAQQGRGDQ